MMHGLFEILSSATAQTLGWTLIHSLWQSLAVFLILLSLRKLISHRFSHARYFLFLSGVAIIPLLSIITFSILYSDSAPSSESLVTGHSISTALPGTAGPPSSEELLYIIQSYMPLFLSVWLLGAVIFSLRLAGGWWYIVNLKRNSTPIGAPWIQRLNDLSYKLGIKQWVELASSASISSPIVFGYLKPIIIVPTSMLTGLTTEQIETIFLHELAHIKRHDYVINVIQTFIESIFFFNPFVWIISGWIRAEREHCCDDVVIAFHENRLHYAQALTRLEEVRTQNSWLPLPLSATKYHLLDRIKRIMEQSVKKYPARERFIPLILFLVGLGCASWLTIQSPAENTSSDFITATSNLNAVLPDSLPDKGNKTEHSAEEKNTSKKNENTALRQEMPEEVDAMDEAFNDSENTFDWDDSTWSVTPFIDMHLNYQFNHLNDMHFQLKMDSFPHKQHWDFEYEKEFEKHFNENFSSFFEFHQKEIERLNQLLNEKFENFSDENWSISSDRIHELQKQLEEEVKRLEHFKQFKVDEIRIDHQALEDMQYEMAKKAERFARQSEALARLNHEHAMRLQNEYEENTGIMDSGIKRRMNMHQFESVLKDQLVKDGYIDKDEKINSLQWSDTNGDVTIEINGKKIKDADEKKYVELYKRHQRF